MNAGECHRTFSERAGLVHQHDIHRARVLEDLAALDDDAELRAPTGSHHDPERRRQPEGAGAGDDQHRHRGAERCSGVVAQEQPRNQRDDGRGNGDGHEHRRHPIGQPLHFCTTALRFVHQADDLSQRRFGADLRRLDDERSICVDRGADHLVAGSHLHRHGLAGHHRRIDRRPSLHNHAVGGDPLARPDNEPHANRQVGKRNFAAIDQSGRPHAQVGERPDGVTRTALSPELQPLAQQDQRDDHCAGFEVHMAVADVGDGHRQRPRQRR